MASPSTLTLLDPQSSLPPNWIHHVFPSFHGADVRKTFLSHVLKAFRSKGIDIFIDNDIERSKSIGHVLIEAIRGSRIAIVVLSQNYASSTWCLNELVQIMKFREEFGQTVIVVFYQVNPTDIKKHSGYFGKVFRETCKGKTKEEVKRWKHALTEVAQTAGYHSINWETEAEMIEDITTDVSNKLNNSAPSNDFDGLVGIESHMTKMRPLLQLDSNEVRKIGILGPPGIGKTTIARCLFNRYSRDFQMSVFMDNIKRKYSVPSCSDDYYMKLELQNQFMSQLTNETCIRIPHLGVAKDRLKDKKVLVVLDDVDRLAQLDAMAKETCWFGPGSRIIITTQDQKVLKASGINHIHMVNLPSNDDALQMFCMYAFDQKDPKDGFKNLACEVISILGRLPVGLRVMGSYFRGMSIQDWTDALPRLRTHVDHDGEIANILKFSYDALCDENKSLFLHIACFFNDELVDIVEGCLAKCLFDVTQGLRILAEKSLISMEWGDIQMAELLVQLGRNIMRKQSVSEPGKRLFLNDAVDIGEVLSDVKSDGSNVIGIYLNEDITCTSEKAFERLYNLQFLRIGRHGVHPQSMNYMSRKLRFLSWDSFQMACFPSSFNPMFLVKLKMSFSKLEKLWEGNQPLSNLKWMNLSHSERLKELPDLSTATNLYDLNLACCRSLVKLPSSIGNAINLKYLDLDCCSSLVEIPSSIRNAINLRELNCLCCSSLVEIPSGIGNAVNLRELDLSKCSNLVVIPSTITTITNLKSLQLRGCSSLVELPLNIETVTDPIEIDLSHCSSLVKLPSSIGNATNLQELNLNYCSNLVELPSSMKNLCRLSKLELKECSKLEVILANINLLSLRELNLSDCSLLKGYHESSADIQHPYPWIRRISSLQKLVLRGMKKLVSLPPLPDSILVLDAENCESLERLYCSFRNPVVCLNFANCFRLNKKARDLIIQTRTNKYAVFPAEEVPMCFTYRSNGSSVTVRLNEMHLVGKSTKFKACFIFVDEAEERSSFWEQFYVCCSITSGGIALIACSTRVEPFSSGHLFIFEVEVETEKVTSTELVFEFDVELVDPCNERKGFKTWGIKECGVLQLLDVPLLSYGDGDEYYESSDTESSGDDDEDCEFSDNEGVGDDDEDYESSDNESVGDDGEDYEPSDHESLGDDDDDYEPSDNESFGDDDEDYEPSDNEI